MRPLVTWSTLVAAGIALQGRLGLAPAVWTALAAALGLPVAVGTARGRRMAPLALALVVVTGAGWLAQHEARLEAGLAPFFDGRPVVLTGQVVDFPEADGARRHVVVRVDRVERGAEVVAAAGRVRVTMPSTVEVDYGDRVRVRAVLRRPASAGNPGAFDYRDHLRRQGITAVATVSYPRHVSVIARGQLNPFLRLVSRVRAWVAEGLQASLTPEQAGVMTGLVLGERQDLSPELEDTFRRAGVTHLLAVSGLHVGFVATAGWRLLRTLRVPRVASALAGAALVWLYVLATGARPPAVRAGVGTTLGLLAAAVGRDRDLATALALAALVLMVQNPLVLFDVSFQLTFAATAGILLAYGPLSQAMAKLPRALAGAVAVTAGAQLGVTPLLAYYFQEISLVGFAASLIGAPLTGILVPLGLASGLLFHLWPGGAQLLAAVVGWGLEALLAATAAFAGLPWAVVPRAQADQRGDGGLVGFGRCRAPLVRVGPAVEAGTAVGMRAGRRRRVVGGGAGAATPGDAGAGCGPRGRHPDPHPGGGDSAGGRRRPPSAGRERGFQCREGRHLAVAPAGRCAAGGCGGGDPCPRRPPGRAAAGLVQCPRGAGGG